MEDTDKIAYIQAQNLQFMRNARNQLLEKTDKYMLPDFPISDDKKEQIKIYRQALRDYFNRDDVINWQFTFEVQHPPDLPNKPDFI